MTSPDPNVRPPPRKGPGPSQRRLPGGYLIILLGGLWMLLLWLAPTSVKTIPYSEFKQRLAAGEVKDLRIEVDAITGRIVPKPTAPTPTEGTPGETPPPTPPPDTTTPPAAGAPESTTTEFAFRTERVDDEKLVEKLEAAGVEYVGVRPGIFSQLFWALMPLLLLVMLFVFLFRRSSGPSVLSMGKSRAKLVADKDTGVTFADVAGCDEAKAELQEVVDFLRNPDRYRALGAKIPKGVLLAGPPGTGKTLLARSVAGEAEVPFFSLSGSDFVEMFVGVGAARVRDLFQQAAAKAPCIIFIDELDAIGRARGVHVAMVNDEREQTLNQLLVEMDGFEVNKGVILLAATNRPDVLDRALLRPGRFDRQVLVDSPDIDGREAILKVHSRNKPLDPAANLRRIAQATPGFSGADLANAMNEAALLAARRGGKQIEQQDLEDAVEKVIAGPERRSRRLSEDDKRRVAYHEVGHALVTFTLDGPGKVHKISIVPRGRAALGYTMNVPEENQFILTRTAMLNEVTGLLGGRAAEDVVFGEVSTGAGNDLERATDMVRRMVTMLGMSDVVGLSNCARPTGSRFLDPESTQLDCSDETARIIDQEVRRMLDDCYASAKEILTRRRDDLERVGVLLLQRESIDGPTFEGLLQPSASTEAEESTGSDRLRRTGI